MFIDNIDKNMCTRINVLDTIHTKKNKVPNNFLDYVQKELGEISDIQNTAKIKSEKFQLNQSESSLNDIMIDLQKSAISIQMAIQIKNKIVSAYQEIMHQQI